MIWSQGGNCIEWCLRWDGPPLVTSREQQYWGGVKYQPSPYSNSQSSHVISAVSSTANVAERRKVRKTGVCIDRSGSGPRFSRNLPVREVVRSYIVRNPRVESKDAAQKRTKQKRTKREKANAVYTQKQASENSNSNPVPTPS